MPLRRNVLACAPAILLAACSPQADDTRNQPGAADITEAAPAPAREKPTALKEAEPKIVALEDGLLVETPGHGQRLKFGQTTPADAERSLAAAGVPKRSSNSECPAGPLDFMDWPNGLQLAFQDGKLAGWWATDKAVTIATNGGLRPGSPRSAVHAPVQGTSVGKLFTVDGVNGVLDDRTETEVSALWAGAACIFD